MKSNGDIIRRTLQTFLTFGICALDLNLSIAQTAPEAASAANPAAVAATTPTVQVLSVPLGGRTVRLKVQTLEKIIRHSILIKVEVAGRF